MSEHLSILYKQLLGLTPEHVVEIAAQGSNRQIYRLTSPGKSLIGVINLVESENKCFRTFSEHFRALGFPVPKVVAVNEKMGAYLQEDLGDVTLLDALQESRRSTGQRFSKNMERYYEEALDVLLELQVDGAEKFPFEMCYPRKKYDREAIMIDVERFRDSFLRRTTIGYDPEKLAKDFEVFAQFLLDADGRFLMHYDYQGRNLMISKDKVWFIDFQHARQGPLHWDVVSLLYQSSAEIPQASRDRLLEGYLLALESKTSITREAFLRHFDGYVLLRLLQVLGRYGEMGLSERRQIFIQNIPQALQNLATFLTSARLPVDIPELKRVLKEIVQVHSRVGARLYQEPLVVNVFSFSYRVAGIPRDADERGGGFVFDCRCLPNPGRELEYRDMTGQDQPVIDYFRERPEVDQFLSHICAIAEQAVSSYVTRGFTNLSIGLGCTGGQHRSVYSSEMVTAFLREKFKDVEVTLRHLHMPISILSRGPIENVPPVLSESAKEK